MHEFWSIRARKLDMPEYRAVIVECGCAVAHVGYRPTPCSGAVTPHHTVYQSEGAASSDLDCIGICEGHHREAHRLGRDKFAATYRLDYERLKRQYLLYFFERIKLASLPEVVARPKKTTRKNRKPLKKKFIPLNER